MHTARQLDAAMFSIELGGRSASFQDLLPGWTADSRLGVVVRQPLGALGASFLIQAAMTAFYDARPSRRKRPLSAEVFLFHAGGRFGGLAPMDVWPPRKEVLVGPSPQDLLAAINNCAITHLVLPEGPMIAADHHYKEPDAAHDRIAAAYLYSPGGRVVDADLSIAVEDARALEDIEAAVRPQGLLAAVEANLTQADPASAPEKQRFAEALRAAVGDVPSAIREAAGQARSALQRPGGAVLETYRRLSVEEAIAHL
jgi:hypothetical protein